MFHRSFKPVKRVGGNADLVSHPQALDIASECNCMLECQIGGATDAGTFPPIPKIGGPTDAGTFPTDSAVHL